MTGRITDEAGDPLHGATVEVAGKSLQGTRTGVTGPDGQYRLPALPPGTYLVRASLPGFATAEQNARVSLDSAAAVNLTLRIETREEITVSGEAPFVDRTSTTTGTNYTANVISHLPVGRNYADILRINPGVFVDRGATQGRSLALSIYGATSAENQWVIDGVNATSVNVGIQGKAINNEFIQEVEVKTGGYQAEYGRALGGHVNVITKSGGNEFHGDGFFYYDSAALKADRVFNQGEDSPLSGMRLANYRRVDFGVDLGGFLLKDRLWFFAAYDRVEFPASVSRYESSKLVPATMEFPLEGTDNLYSGKLTWNIASGTGLVASVFADPTVNSGAGSADPRQGGFNVRMISNPNPGTWEASRFIGGTDYGLRGTQLLGSTGLLTLQAARHQERYQLEPSGAGLQVRFLDFTCDGGTREQPCDIPAEPQVSGGYGLVLGAGSHNKSYRNQLRADVNLYTGAHEIKFGADYQNGRTSAVNFYSGGQRVSQRNEYGQLYYEHVFSARSEEDLSLVGTETVASAREFGVYVQDSWKVAPGLTVNAGLRWDKEQIRNYRNVPVLLLTNEWQPRLGVAWDPKEDGTTKLYAFAGRFYYSLPTDIGVRAFGSRTLGVTYNFDPVDVTPDPEVYNHESSVREFTDLTPVDEGISGVYLDEYTVGAEKLLGPTLSLGLMATYRKLGNAIEDRCDLDWQEPENNGTSCAITNPGSSGRYARGDFAYCTGLVNDLNNCTEDPERYQPLYGAPPMPRASRVYQGIELVARKSFNDGYWLQASYVLSSLKGNYDGAVNEGFGGQTDPGINVDFDYAGFVTGNVYGRLYLDRPHSLRLDGFYTTPFRVSIGFESWLRSGAPLNRMGFFNDSGAQVYLVPRGDAGRLPMEWDASLTLEYPIQFGPVTVTFQGYLYNLFNNQVPTSRDEVWSSQAPANYPDSIYDPNQDQSNENYGLVTGRSDPRLFRVALRVSF